MEASAVLGALNHLLETHTEREQGYLSRLAGLDSYVEHLQNELDLAHEHIRKLQQQQGTALQCNLPDNQQQRAKQHGAIPQQPAVGGAAPATNADLRALEQHYQYLLDIQDQKLKMYYTKYKRYKLNFQELLRSKVCELCNAELVRNTALPNGMDRREIAPLPIKQAIAATSATVPPGSHHINGHLVNTTNAQRGDQQVAGVQYVHQPAADPLHCQRVGDVHGTLPGQTGDVEKQHDKQPITTQHDAGAGSFSHNVQPSMHIGLHTTSVRPVDKQPSCDLPAHSNPIGHTPTTNNVPVSAAQGVGQKQNRNIAIDHVPEDCNVNESMHHYTIKHGGGLARTTPTHLQPLQLHQPLDDCIAVAQQKDASSMQQGLTAIVNQLCKQGSHGGKQSTAPVSCGTTLDTSIDRHVVRIPQWPAVPVKLKTADEGSKPTSKAQHGEHSMQNGVAPGSNRQDWKTEASPAVIPDMNADAVAKHSLKQHPASLLAEKETTCDATMQGFDYEQKLSDRTRMATTSFPTTSKDHAGINLIRPAANPDGSVRQRTGLIDMLMGESISQEGSDAQGRACPPPPANGNVTNAQPQQTTQDASGQVASLADGFACLPPVPKQQQVVQVAAEQRDMGPTTVVLALNNGSGPRLHDVTPQTRGIINDIAKSEDHARLNTTANNRQADNGYANGIIKYMADPGFFILPGTEFPESPQVTGGKTSAPCSNHGDGNHGGRCVDEAWARHHSNGINNANQVAGLLVPGGVMQEESNQVSKPAMNSRDKLHSKCQNSPPIPGHDKIATTALGGQVAIVAVRGNEGAACDVDSLKHKDQCATVDTIPRGIIPTDVSKNTDESCSNLQASTPTKHAAYQVEVIEIYSPEAGVKQPPAALLAAEPSSPSTDKLLQPPLISRYPQLLGSPFSDQANVDLHTKPRVEHPCKLQAEHANSEPTTAWPKEAVDRAATAKNDASKLLTVQDLVIQKDLCSSLSDDLNHVNCKTGQLKESEVHLLNRREAAMAQPSCEPPSRYDDTVAWNTKTDRAQRSQSFDSVLVPANKGSKAVQSLSQPNKKQSKILTCKGYVRKSTPVIRCDRQAAEKEDIDPLDRVPPVVVKGFIPATDTVTISNYNHRNNSHSDVGAAGPEIKSKQSKQHVKLGNSQEQIKHASSQPSDKPLQSDASRRQRRAKPNKAAKRQLPDALSPTALGSPLAVSPHIKVKGNRQLFDELDAEIEKEAHDRQTIGRPEKPLTAEEKQQLGSITMVLFQQAGLDSQAVEYESADDVGPSHGTFGMNAGHKQAASRDIDAKRSSEAAQKELEVPRKQHKSIHSREHSVHDIDMSQEPAAEHTMQQAAKQERHSRAPENGAAGYKYAEVVRGAARADLNGYACDTCRAFYEACVSWDVELHEPMCGHARPAAASVVGAANTTAAAAAKDALIQGLSKHRARYVPPPSTPDGFWALTFPDESKMSSPDPFDA